MSRKEGGVTWRKFGNFYCSLMFEVAGSRKKHGYIVLFSCL